jgi:hypothetical protein
MRMIYRIYLVGGTDDQPFGDRPIDDVVWAQAQGPNDEEQTRLFETYGQGRLLPCIEQIDTPRPKTVSELMGGR